MSSGKGEISDKTKLKKKKRKEKNNEDVQNFAGKWMELENSILSKVTQIQNDMHGMYSQISGC